MKLICIVKIKHRDNSITYKMRIGFSQNDQHDIKLKASQYEEMKKIGVEFSEYDHSLKKNLTVS